MAWRLAGQYYAPCSCNIGCPCLLGAPDGDQGWCSAFIVLDITSGNLDGVDLGATKVALAGDWPRGFTSGNGKGRLFLDSACTPQQRQGLEKILSGNAGGVFEILASLMTEMLPTQDAHISVQRAEDQSRITIGDFADFAFQPLKGSSGEPTRLLHGAAAFRDDVTLGKNTNSHSRAPDMREWQSLGHIEFTEFDYSA
jgi:hypothetical protein